MELCEEWRHFSLTNQAPSYGEQDYELNLKKKKNTNTGYKDRFHSSSMRSIRIEVFLKYSIRSCNGGRNYIDTFISEE